jgi:signal transduction histidine kinase
MILRAPRDLTTRLTLWYAGVFSFCFLLVFGVFYSIMHDQFHRWTDEQLREEVTEVKMAYEEGGREGVVHHLNQEEVAGDGRFMGRIIESSGAVGFVTTSRRYDAIFGIDAELLSEARSGRGDVSRLTSDHDQSAGVIYSRLPDGSVVQLGQPLLDHEMWLREFIGDVGKVSLLALFLALIAGGLIARHTLAPIRKVAATASEIPGRSLGQRVPLSGRKDEVDRLAEAFNGMLDRIDTLVQGIRDVTDTLAHDLRTPITGIRGFAEITLRAPRGEHTYQMALYQIIDRLDHLLALSESILDVAEAESGVVSLNVEVLSLDSLMSEVAQTFMPVAKDKGIHFEQALPTDMQIKGDRRRLEQAVANKEDFRKKHQEPDSGSAQHNGDVFHRAQSALPRELHHFSRNASVYSGALAGRPRDLGILAILRTDHRRRGSLS